MQLENPQQFVGSYIRIRRHGANRHFGRGRLLRIEGRRAVVKPFGHGKEERVPIADLYSWEAGNRVEPRNRRAACRGA